MLSRVLSRSVASKTFSLGVRTASNTSIEERVSTYSDDFVPNIPDLAHVKQDFAQGLHPDIVSNKAFQNSSFSSMRLNSDILQEGQHPALVKLIKTGLDIDKETEASLDRNTKLDPLFDQTRHFEYGLYRKGDEDSVLDLKIDWDFYKKFLDDSEFVDVVKKSYEQSMEEIEKESQSINPIPEEEFALINQFYSEFEKQSDAHLAPYAEALDNIDYDEQNIPLLMHDIIEQWDDVKMWVSAPQVAAECQHNIDNSIWAMEDESTWGNDVKRSK